MSSIVIDHAQLIRVYNAAWWFAKRHEDVYRRWAKWEDTKDTYPEFMRLCETVLSGGYRGRQHRRSGAGRWGGWNTGGNGIAAVTTRRRAKRGP